MDNKFIGKLCAYITLRNGSRDITASTNGHGKTINNEDQFREI